MLLVTAVVVRLALVALSVFLEADEEAGFELVTTVLAFEDTIEEIWRGP